MNRMEAETYKLEIEKILSTMKIYRGEKVINKNLELNLKNKEFVKGMFMRIKAGNFDEEIFDQVFDELIPYLYEKKESEVCKFNSDRV